MASHPTLSTPSAPGIRSTSDALTSPRLRSLRLTALVAPLVLSAGAAVALLQHRAPPPPVAGTADAFSTARALAHIERLAVEPRPSGSRAAGDARVYIMDELARLQMAPVEQQTTILTRSARGRHTWSAVRNVLGRLPGQSSTRAVLLMAHYDSHVSSPGAADNASSVATLLEAARVLSTGPPLRNDVIWLFTDGEEGNLAGAEAFVSGHPWAREIGAVLNFEARGATGPSLMFETIGGSGALIREMAGVMPYPRASSIYDQIYDAMPNDTDLTGFRRLGVPGLNFAFIERPGAYHTSGDTAAVLDRASVHHHGVNAVELARGLARADLHRAAEPDPVFFTVGNALFHYSRISQLAQAAIAWSLLALCWRWAARTRHVRTRHIGTAIMTAIGAVLACAAIAFAIWAASVRTVPPLASASLRLYMSPLVVVGIVLVSIAGVCAALALIRRSVPRVAAILGGAAVGLVAGTAAALLAPGTGYLLLWPALADLLCIAILLRFGDGGFWSASMNDAVPCQWRDALLSVACALPAVFLVTPVVHVVLDAIGVRALPVAAALVSIEVALAWPMLLSCAGAHLSRASALLAIGGAAALTLGTMNARTSPRWPKHDSVFYARSLDEDKAVWATRERQRDSWTTQFLGTTPRWGVPFSCLAGAGQMLYNEAAALPIATASIGVTRNELGGNRRTFEVAIQADGDTGLAIVSEPSAAQISLVAVNDVLVDERYRQEQFASLNARTDADRSVTARFETSSTEAMSLTLISSTDGVPDAAVSPRPAAIVRGGEGRLFNDASVTCRTVTIDPVVAAAVRPVPQPQ